MVQSNYHNLLLPKSLTQPQQPPKSMLHINTLSASDKGDTIAHFLNEFQFKFKLVVLTETWYRDDGDQMELDGYNTFVPNRKNRRGGGVNIFVATTLKFKLVSQFSEISNEYEMSTVKLNRDIVSVVYRPPSGNGLPFLSFVKLFSTI